MTAVKHSSLALYGKLEGAVLVESNGDLQQMHTSVFGKPEDWPTRHWQAVGSEHCLRI